MAFPLILHGVPGPQPPPEAPRPLVCGGGAESEETCDAGGGDRRADDDVGDGAEAALNDGESGEEEGEEEDHDVGVDRADDGRYVVSDESSDVEGEPVPDEADDRKDNDATGFEAFVVRELPKLDARRPNLPYTVRQILLHEQWETLAPSQRQVGCLFRAQHRAQVEDCSLTVKSCIVKLGGGPRPDLCGPGRAGRSVAHTRPTAQGRWSTPR